MRRRTQMSKLHGRWIALAAAAALAGCPSKSDMSDGLSRDELSDVLNLFNADLGSEGVAVSKQELQAAVESDPELLDALRSDRAAGFVDLIAMLDSLSSDAETA